jgi:hypothetical protein
MEEHPELSVAEATKQAMREITAPIIAITLVIEYDHGDQIPAVLLQSSHCGGNH